MPSNDVLGRAADLREVARSAPTAAGDASRLPDRLCPAAVRDPPGTAPRDPAGDDRARPLALTLALGATAAAGVVWLAVERADAPWALAPRMMPDIAAGLSAIVLMGLGWGPLRTILLLRAAAAGRKQAV